MLAAQVAPSASRLAPTGTLRAAFLGTNPVQGRVNPSTGAVTGPVADLVRELYNSGDRKKAAAAVADDLIDAIAICGPAGHCREQLAEWRKHGMGRALLNLPTGAPYEIAEHMLRAVAPR